MLYVVIRPPNLLALYDVPQALHNPQVCSEYSLSQMTIFVVMRGVENLVGIVEGLFSDCLWGIRAIDGTFIGSLR